MSRKLYIWRTSRFLQMQPGIALHEDIFTLSYTSRRAWLIRNLMRIN